MWEKVLTAIVRGRGRRRMPIAIGTAGMYVTTVERDSCDIIRVHGSAVSTGDIEQLRLRSDRQAHPPRRIFHLATGVPEDFQAEFEVASCRGAAVQLSADGGEERKFPLATVPDVESGDTPPYANLLDSEQVLGRDQIYGSGPPVHVVFPPFVTHGKRLPAPVLDVGCGAGAFVRALRELGVESRGIELVGLRDKALEEVRAHLTFYDGGALPFADATFGSATAFEVLEHVDDPGRVLQEMRRVVREAVLISVPDISAIPMMANQGVVPWHLLEATHYHFFTARSLAATVENAGLRVEGITRVGDRRINGSLMPGSLLLRAARR